MRAPLPCLILLCSLAAQARAAVVEGDIRIGNTGSQTGAAGANAGLGGASLGLVLIPSLNPSLSPSLSGPTPLKLAEDMQTHMLALAPMIKPAQAGRPASADGVALGAALRLKLLSGDADPAKTYAAMALLRALSRPERADALESYLGKEQAGRAASAKLKELSAAIDADPQGRAGLASALAQLKQGGTTGEARALEALFDGSLERAYAAEAPAGAASARKLASARLAPADPARASAPRIVAVPAPARAGVLHDKAYSPENGVKLLDETARRSEPYTYRALNGEWLILPDYLLGPIRDNVLNGNLTVFKNSDGKTYLASTPDSPLRPHEIKLAAMIKESRIQTKDIRDARAAVEAVRERSDSQDLAGPVKDFLKASDRYRAWRQRHDAAKEDLLRPKPASTVSRIVAGLTREEPMSRSAARFLTTAADLVSPAHARTGFTLTTVLSERVFYRFADGSMAPLNTEGASRPISAGAVTVRRGKDGDVLAGIEGGPLAAREPALTQLLARGQALTRSLNGEFDAIIALMNGSRGKRDIAGAIAAVAKLKEKFTTLRGAWRGERDLLLLDAKKTGGDTGTFELMKAVLEASDPADAHRDISLSSLLQAKYGNADAMLAALYPHLIADLRKLFPRLASFQTDDFEQSLFVEEKLVRAMIDNRKRFQGENIRAASSHALRDIGFIVLRGDDMFKTRIRSGDHLLPYPVPGLEGAAETQDARAVVKLDAANGEGKAKLKERFKIFNELIESNFRVLPLMNGLASLPKSGARAVVAEVGVMVRHYAALTESAGRGEQGEEVRERYAAVVAEIEALWKNLPEQEPLPAAVAARLGTMELGAPLERIKNLHTLVNYMHQASFSALGGGERSGSDGTGSLVAANHTGFMDLGDEPLIKGRRLVSKPLAALMQIAERPGSHQSDTVIVRGDEAWVHASMGLHSAEIYVKFAHPDDGGMLRIRYQEGNNRPRGNPLRLAMVKEQFARLGIHGQEDGPRHLNAVIDKDHGLTSESRLAELFPIALQALHETLDMNLGFDQYELKEGRALARDLAGMYLAEGRWTSREWIDNYNFKDAYEQYAGEEARAKRAAGRKALDAELDRLGLPTIPAGADFGQAAIDRYFTRPIREAVIRGQLRLDEKGVPERADYRPVEALAAAAAADPGRAARAASVLNQFGGEIAYVPAGAVGALRAERALWTLGEQTLVVHGLRETETGQLGYARVQAYHPAGGLKELSPAELDGLLRREGRASAAAPVSSAQLAALERQLRAPAPGSTLSGRRVEGLAASAGQGGFVTARVTFKREGAKGGVLLVPFTTPEDIDAIKRSAAVVTTGGGMLSHAAITTRELGIQSMILPAAEWKTDARGAPFLEIVSYDRKEAPSSPDGLAVSPRLEARRLELREGDLVRVNGATGELSVFPGNGLPLAAAESFLKTGGGPLAPSAARFVVEEALLNSRYAGRREDLIAAVLKRPAAESDEARAHGRRVLEARAAEALARLEASEAPGAVAVTAADREIARLDDLLELFGLEKSLLDPLRKRADAASRAQTVRRNAELDDMTAESEKIIPAPARGEDLPPLRRLIKRFERLAPASLTEAAAGLLAALRAREAKIAEAKRKAIAGTAPAVLPLGLVDDDYRGLVGGKLSKLGEILAVVREQGGYVPGAVAATTQAYLRFLKENGLDKKLKAMAEELDRKLADPSLSAEKKQSEVVRLSQSIRALLLSAKLDPKKGLGKELWEAMKARGLDDPAKRLAVRSSAVQEDQADAAFAGAAESYLHVKPEEVLEKIVENWASFWLPRGIVYRHEHGVASVDLLPATIIQEMAEADVAGVIFTQNPVSGEDEIVIAAAYGLGEGIVSGIVQTDRYITRRSDGEETRLPFLGDKRVAVMPKAGESGTELRGVDRAKRGRRSLTPAQTKTLSRIAAALDEHFGYPLDIEFAVKGDRIAILQARPVTSRGETAKPAPEAPLVFDAEPAAEPAEPSAWRKVKTFLQQGLEAAFSGR